jgi:predicted GIY-YIG superfamily endonuclease
MDISFNILECFDENISNLDITRNYIYVLQLVEDRYYVGRTTNILNRIEQHFTGCGAAVYTKKYQPIKVIEIVEELSKYDERNKTIEIMNKYGWEKVRGAHWCSLEIKKPDLNKKIIKKETFKEIKPLNVDIEIYSLYCNENKNIIEIGEIIKRRPSWVAYRLNKLKIIHRIQLARGFFEYYQSDLYKNHLVNIIKNRKENKSDKKIENKKIPDLKNIKQRIRDKILNDKSCDCI